jgi:hypothetical protein
MITFVEFIEKEYPEFYFEASSKGMLGKVLTIAKNMPMTLGALAAATGGLAATHTYEKSVGKLEERPAAEVRKEKLPSLKKSRAKVVGKIEDAGKV